MFLFLLAAGLLNEVCTCWAPSMGQGKEGFLSLDAGRYNKCWCHQRESANSEMPMHDTFLHGWHNGFRI